jgi:PAS domain S-box-containing protein
MKKPQNNLINKIFWQSPNPMAITNEDGTYTEVNETFVEYFGLQPQELIGKTSVESGITTYKERLNLLNEINKNGYAKNFPVNVVAKDNEIRCLLLNTKPMKIKKNKYTLTICTDISLFSMNKKNKRDSVFIKALDYIERTGVILLNDNDKKSPDLFFVNEEAKMILKKQSLNNLLHEMDGKESIYLSVESKFYNVRKMISSDNSSLVFIIMERLPDTIFIKEKIKEHDFTPRQQEIVFWVATGHSNSEIAKKLFITEHTVKDHMKMIFQMLDVHSRSELFPKLLNLR